MRWLGLLLGQAPKLVPAPAAAAPDPAPPDPSAPWTSAIDQMRVAARWILSSFAAVAAVLVAGSQLSELGAVDGERLWLSLAGAAAALVGIGVAVAGMSAVLTPAATTLADLVELEARPGSAFATALSGSPELLKEQAGSVAELRKRYLAARTARAELRTRLDAAPDDPVLQRDHAAADRSVQALREVGTQLRAIGGFFRVRHAFVVGRRWAFFGAFLVAAGMLAFGYAAHPPEDAERADEVAVAAAPAAVTLSLSADGAQRLAPVLGSSCRGAVPALVLGGDPTAYDVVVLGSAQCVATRFTLTPEVGTVVGARPVDVPAR